MKAARCAANWPPEGDIEVWGGLGVYGDTAMKMEKYNHKGDWGP